MLFRSAREDLHPPGYSLIGWLMLSLGDSELWLRLPAFVAGCGAIVAAWAAARAWSLLDGASGSQAEGIGRLAALLVAVAPVSVAWSREARPYSLAVLALFVLLWAVARARRGEKLPLALASLGVLPWHYGGWLVLAAVLAACALDRRSRVPAMMAALVCAPVAWVLWQHAADQFATRGELAHLADHMGLGAVVGLPWLFGWMITGSSSVLALLLGLVVAWRGLRARWRVDPVLLAGFVAVGAAALAGAYPLGPLRHGLVLLPAVVLALAPALAGRASPWIGVLLACTLLRGPGLPVHDVPTLLDALEAHRGDEPVWVDPMLSWPVRRYGLPEGAQLGRWGEPWPDHGWVLTTGEEPADLRAEGVRAVWRAGPRPTGD